MSLNSSDIICAAIEKVIMSSGSGGRFGVSYLHQSTKRRPGSFLLIVVVPFLVRLSLDGPPDTYQMAANKRETAT